MTTNTKTTARLWTTTLIMWTNMKRFANYIAASSLILVGMLTLCGGQPLGVVFGLMMFTSMLGSYGIIPRFWQMFAETNVMMSKLFMTMYERNCKNIII